LRRLRERQEWKFFGALYRSAPSLAVGWWALLILRGLMPVLFAVAMGILIGAVNDEASLTGPLIFVGVVFVSFQILTPLHQLVSSNLGDRCATWMNDRLMDACVKPPGMAHLERPALINDLTMARDFDLGITGPPLSISMDFIASGLVTLVGGIAAALLLTGFAWWAPIVLIVGWGSTHWLLKESAVWRDRNTDEVRTAQRHADYAYRLAVDAPSAKEIRLFGLAGWVVERFRERRHRLYELQWQATRLRERSVIASLVVVAATNALVFWQLAEATLDGDVSLAGVVIYLQAAIGATAIAFGGLSWALDGSAAPAAAVVRLEEAMAPVGALKVGTVSADNMPANDIVFDNVNFTYEAGTLPVLDGFNLTIPAGTSLAIVGQNGAGKTTLAKLLCRLYDPDDSGGTIRVDGQDLTDIDIDSWRSRVTAVFQDFIRYERSLRHNVAPTGADEADIIAAIAEAGAGGISDLDTILAKGYPNGTELSGGQWQRVALARALCGVRQGAGLVLLDEPTAQLDVRGESEIFERVLAATENCTTILVSHRFSTVRLADQICVLEDGRVVELGSHDELIARGGRYKTMFELQASRFVELDEEGEEVVYDTLG